MTTVALTFVSIRKIEEIQEIISTTFSLSLEYQKENKMTKGKGRRTVTQGRSHSTKCSGFQGFHPFLNLSTTASGINSVVRDCLLHCRIFSSFIGLYPPAPYFPLLTTKNVSWHCETSPGWVGGWVSWLVMSHGLRPHK